LGLADKLVAIDKYSADTAGLPGGLVQIDFSYPDAEAILSLEPDIIIASGHNTTVSGDDPFRILREMGIPVTYISMSKSINEIYNDIAFIADLLDVKDHGDALIASMKAQVDEINRKTAQAKIKRSVYFEISALPEIFTFGRDNYINDMITVINGRNIFENDNWVLSPSIEAIIERNPDVILTCVEYLPDPVGEIKSRDGFNHINAVINNRICRIDTNSVVRPSARIILALNQMARSVYPELYE
jgi:iron complex transport system substrate-binding protein